MKQPPVALERYCDLVSDRELFWEACRSPLPLTGWFHPQRAAPFLGPKTFNRDQLPWLENGFKLEDTNQKGFLISFLSGSLLIQEQSAMTAAHLLNVANGDRILDLCAAPGNKTAQISTLLGDSGVVVGNDHSTARLGIVRGTVDRLGLSNVVTTAYDARHFPIPENLFDSVLADVPCSCEGTSRKHPRVLHTTNEVERNRLLPIQEAILRRAIQCTKPGGRIVYSTCTFAPEENERVVHRVISNPPPGCKVVLSQVVIPHFRLSNGLTTWKGEQFDDSLSRTARIWPQENDTGGFYLAVLTRDGNRDTRTASESNFESEPIQRAHWPWAAYDFKDPDLAPFQQIFTESKYDRFVSGKAGTIEGLETQSRGMTGLNTKSTFPRLSTGLALKLGMLAEAGIAHIESNHILDYFERSLRLPAEIIPPREKSRMLIVRSNGMSLGMGRIPNGSNDYVQSLFPKTWGGIEIAQRIKRMRR